MLRKVDWFIVHSSWFKVKDFLCILVSAVLLILAFPKHNLWPLAWFGFVPVFLRLNNKSQKQAFALFFITGILFWTGIVYWLVNVTLPGTIILVLYLALYFGFFGLIIRPYTRHSMPYVLIFIPSVWVCLEYIRGWLFTGFPWVLLGYSQYLNLPLIQVADITGAWGISFLVMFVNVAVVEIIWSAKTKRKPRFKNTLLALIFVLSVILFYGYLRLHELRTTNYEQKINISVIQGNIPQELKWEPLARGTIVDKYFYLTHEGLKNKPDLIIWPEAALPVVIEDNPEYLNKINSFSKEINVPLLLGAVRNNAGQYYNKAILLSGKDESVTEYAKIHLVPFGEYIPLRKILPFLEVVVPIGDFSAGKEYTVFTHDARRTTRDQIRFSVLICFEDLFPNLSRRFVRQGADFLVNITNDAWFGRTSSPYQHFSASVFRAVENRVPVVRAANTGVSGFIASSGRIIYASRIFVDDFTAKEIKPYAHRRTFYNRTGDAFIFICFLFIFYGIIAFRKNKT